MVRDELSRWRQDLSCGQGGELLSYEGAGALDLKPSHPCPSKYVASVPFRNRYLRESEDAAREILSNVALYARCARGWPNQTEHFAGFARYRPGMLKARLHR